LGLLACVAADDDEIGVEDGEDEGFWRCAGEVAIECYLAADGGDGGTLVSLCVPREDLLLPPDEIAAADNGDAEDDDDYEDAGPGCCAGLWLKSTAQVYRECLAALRRRRPSTPADGPLLSAGPVFGLIALSASTDPSAVPPPARPPRPAVSAP
jgi:hypothetical protein